MTCQHATPITPQVNSCSLNRYGGRPSAGVCRGCIERGENRADFVPPPAPSTPPPLLTQARTAMAAAGRFAASGFTPTPPAILAEREATCRACLEWDAEALNGTGRCRKCGCSTWAKLRMATESCPLGKWQAVSPSSVPSPPLPE